MGRSEQQPYTPGRHAGRSPTDAGRDAILAGSPRRTPGRTLGAARWGALVLAGAALLAVGFAAGRWSAGWPRGAAAPVAAVAPASAVAPGSLASTAPDRPALVPVQDGNATPSSPVDPREMFPLPGQGDNPGAGQQPGQQPGQPQQGQQGQGECQIFVFRDGRMFMLPGPGQPGTQPGQGGGQGPGQGGGPAELYPLDPMPSQPGSPAPNTPPQAPPAPMPAPRHARIPADPTAVPVPALEARPWAPATPAL